MSKNKAAVHLGRKSAKKRHKGKSKAEISAFYKDLRQRGLDTVAIPKRNI